MTRYLYWKDNQIIETDEIVEGPQLHVDMQYMDPDARYGKWKDNAWVPVPLSEFPPEFQMHLLLMGIT